MSTKNVNKFFALGLMTFIAMQALGAERDGHPSGGGGDFVVTIIPDPKHTTAEGTVHNCLNEEVELSWTGYPTPPSSACEGEWEEQVNQRTFEWTGAIDGATNANKAKLDTRSEGQATVNLTVTCKWICSDSRDTQETKGKGSLEVLIVKGEDGEDPDTPSDGPIDLPDKDINHVERKAVLAGGRYVSIEYRHTGSMTEVSGQETYDEGEALLPGGCGIDVNRPWTAGGVMSNISFMFERAVSSFSKVRLEWNPFETNTLEITIPRQEFRKARIKVFRRSISNPTGKFTGTYSWTTISGPPRGETTSLRDAPFTANGDQTYEYVHVRRFTKCCPSD